MSATSLLLLEEARYTNFSELYLNQWPALSLMYREVYSSSSKFCVTSWTASPIPPPWIRFYSVLFALPYSIYRVYVIYLLHGFPGQLSLVLFFLILYSCFSLTVIHKQTDFSKTYSATLLRSYCYHLLENENSYSHQLDAWVVFSSLKILWSR